MRSAATGIPLFLIVLFGALFVASCATTEETSSTPQVPSAWSDPAVPPKPYRNLVVFGVAANGKVRRAYEDDFVAALKARGVTARAGHGLLRDGGLADVKAVRKAVGQSGADGVIVTHLVGERTDAARVSPGSYVTPSLYGSLYPYYQRVYGYVTEPGYYAHYPVLQLETNLYDAPREKLVWSARSETMDPGSEKTTIRQVIASAIKRLAEAGYLPR